MIRINSSRAAAAASIFCAVAALFVVAGSFRAEAQLKEVGERPAFTPKPLPPGLKRATGTDGKAIAPPKIDAVAPVVKPATPTPPPPADPRRLPPNSVVPPPPPQRTPKPVQDQAQPTPFPEFAPKGLALHYIGRRNGEIEPCGCVKNQLGGIQFEASIYGMTPRDNSIRLDAGGWMNPTFSPEGVLKAGYALRAMGGYLDLDAVNATRVDIEFGAEALAKLAKEHPEAGERLVSANVYKKDRPGEPAFAPYRLVKRTMVAGGPPQRIAITGVCSDVVPHYATPEMREPNTARDYTIGDSSEALGRVIGEIGDQADMLIVLAYNSAEEVKKLATDHPEIDAIVSAMPTGLPDGPIPGTKTVAFSVPGAQGKQVGRVDLLRDADGSWTTSAPPDTLGVSPKLLVAHDPMIALIEDYKKTTEQLLMKMPYGVPTTWAGANKCAGCHPDEYADWKGQLHSKALETLIRKGSQFDPACLKCHTVGFQKDNGFYNMRDQFHLGGVQCENCHGPSNEHANKENLIRNKSIDRFSPEEREKFLAEAKAAIPPKQVPESTCVQCHYGDNDPHWNYELKLPKVNHSAAISAKAGGAADPHAGQRVAPGALDAAPPAPGVPALQAAPPAPVPVTAPPPPGAPGAD